MKNAYVIFFTGVFALLNGGCAWLTTYKSSMKLDSKSYSLDVKQRIVLSQNREGENGKTRRVVCAEPSPDALTTISASAGIDVANAIAASANSGDTSTSASSNQGAKVTAALAEQGAFVGLRTQSIQLLRDAMYRACEGFAAGAVSEVEFTAMQRRYQSTMLGLLAIEQLTRPVVAAQVVLASNASAQAGASAGDAAVDKAQQRLDQKITDETQAQVKLNAAKAEVAAAEKKLRENDSSAKIAREKAEKETAGDAAARKAAGDSAAKNFDDARPELQGAIDKAKTSERAAMIEASAATQAKQLAQTDLNAAKSKASASAGGNGQIGALREASAQMTQDLAKGVFDIVKEINESYGRDGCLAVIQGLVRLDGKEEAILQRSISSVQRTALDVCAGILENTRIRELQALFERQTTTELLRQKSNLPEIKPESLPTQKAVPK